MIQETIECYILNLILELDNEYFIWIWLSNLIIKNAFKFDYIFNSYHMWCIRVKIIFLINFLSCTMSCILQKHHNLAFNKIIFFSLKLSQSLFIFSHYIAFIFSFFFFCLSWHHIHHEYHNLDFWSCSNSVHYNKRILNRDYWTQSFTNIYFYLLNWW